MTVPYETYGPASWSSEVGQVKRLPSRERVRPREDEQEKLHTPAVSVWSRCTKRIKPQDLRRGDTSSTFEVVGADQHRENYCLATVVQVEKRLVRNRHIGSDQAKPGNLTEQSRWINGVVKC